MITKTPARLRIEAGHYSIWTLSKMAGIDPDTLSRYESGKLHFLSMQTMNHWRKLAYLCHVTYEKYRDAVLDQRARVLKK